MISEEAQAIRQTFRITLALTGAAFCITYLLADWIGFERPVQAGLIVMLVCLTLLALGILAVVLTERFCEVLELEDPVRPVPKTPSKAKTLFSSTRRGDDTLDLYLRRIYREVAPGDRSYIRKSGGLGPARQKLVETRTGAPLAPAATGSVMRPVLSPRVEPFRTSNVTHPKPYRGPRD